MALVLRFLLALVGALPARFVHFLGRALGRVAYVAAIPYRRLAQRNLRIAFPEEATPAIRALAAEHFARLGANVLGGMRAAPLPLEKIRPILAVEGFEQMRALGAGGRGMVMVLNHLGNWEMGARLAQFLAEIMPDRKYGTVYQPLRNPAADRFVRSLRGRNGLHLFSRHDGFAAPTAFLREGGVLGVLADQHAGDAGAWVPLFGRLASTTTLPALLALRSGAGIMPVAIYSAGPGRWRAVAAPPVAKIPLESVEMLTARINQAVEAQVRQAPADWFWVHNRWKTPQPKFLLATYKRGVTLPPAMSVESLRPFQILVRSPNWLGDAVMAVPAVRAIATGRPDARLTVLSPAKLADFWRTVPEVAEVLSIEAEKSGIFAVAEIVRNAGPFEAAVLLPHSIRSALEVWLGRVPRRAGYAGHSRRWLLNQIVPEPELIPGPTRPHHSERYLHLARTIGAIDPPPPAGTGSLPKSAAAFARIGIVPGAEYGPTKRWFPDRFAAAAKTIAAARPARFALFGVARDAEIGAAIEKDLVGLECDNRIGQTSLTELIAELRACDLLLTNDTGTMHLAAHLGVPLVAIFGSTDHVVTAPLSLRARIVRHQVECSPCFLRECPLDLRCLRSVTGDEVAAAALELLTDVKVTAPFSPSAISATIIP